MASDNEASCESDPNFAVICAFMEKFGGTCGLASIDFLELQEMLENTQEVPQELIDLHIKLLRKSRKTVSTERWERAIIRICHGFCVQDAWEIERFGYKKARLSSKIRVLKELLEMQFDYNVRFKAEINKMSAEELRSQPLGKDKQGHAYWYQNDSNCQIRVYKEDPDEETWTLVAKDREGLVSLINELSNGESKFSSESTINEEDSNSLAEKPIIDTGQVDSSSSDSKKASSESENSNEESKKEENISTPPEETAQENEESEEEEKSESPPHLTAESDPTTKRSRESDEEDDDDAKKAKVEESAVGEAIEEPVMLVKGEGNGEDNQCVNRIEENPIVGEEIEEDLMYFYGCGSGHECQTGNEDEEGKKASSTSEGGSVSSDKSTNKDAGGSENYVSIRCSDSKNCVSEDTEGSSKEVPTSPVKSLFKLGTIIDTKTDNKFFNASRTPKKSRWDVETIIAKEPNCVEQSINDEEEKEEAEVTSPKKSMFFFGPGCLVSPSGATVAFGQKVPQEDFQEKFEEKKDCCSNEGPVIPSNTKGDIGYRIENSKEVDKTIECVQSSEENEEASRVDRKTPIESRVNDKLDDRNAENEETKAKDVEEKEVETIKIDHDTESKEDEIKEKIIKIDHVTESKEDEIKETTLESKLKEEIVPEEQIAATEISTEEMQKLPQVTATLVECKEVKTKETISESKVESIGEEPTPVIEEQCIKKQAYVLGEETEDLEETQVNSIGAKVKKSNSVNEARTKSDEESAIKDEGESALSVSVIKKVASEENILNLKVEEAKDSQQPNCEAVKEKKEDVRSGKEKEAKGPANNTNNKGVRGRKNNLSQDQPRIFTRRTTRSSKNEEVAPKTIEEKSKSTETNQVSSVKEEKKAEKMEGPPRVAVTPRRGRSRGVIKAGREETVDGNGSKKMKMYGSVGEETETKTTRQTRNKVKEKMEKKIEENMENKTEDKAEKKVEEKMKQTAEENLGDKTEEETEKKVDEKTEKNAKEDAEEKSEEKTAEEAEEKMERQAEEVEAKETKTLPELPMEAVTIDSSNSSDLVELPDKDPLAGSDEEANNEERPMSLATFSLDFDESPTPTPPLTRSGLRKRGRESPPNNEEAEETAGKRLKKGKRIVDVKLRKSIEEQKKHELISSDEDKTEKKSPKKKGGKHKKETKNEEEEETVIVSSDDDVPKEEKEPVQKKNKMNRTERMLSSLGISPEQVLGLGEEMPVGVRQSRRIAQLKIKEEAERRKLEEEMGQEAHKKKKKKKKSDDKDYKIEKKRLKEGEDDEVQDDSGDSKKKKKKKKKHRKLFDELNPWRSSSDSSSTDEEEDDEICDESDDEVLQYVSDHEFSPESDMEGDGEALPLKRARTARKDVSQRVDHGRKSLKALVKSFLL